MTGEGGKTVVFYLSDFKEERKFLTLCAKKNIRTRKANAGSLRIQAGKLCNLSQLRQDPEPQPLSGRKKLPDFLFLSGFSEAERDSFLDTCKDEGIKTGLIAVLTQSNAVWSLDKLLLQLQKEQDFYEKDQKKQKENQ